MSANFFFLIFFLPSIALAQHGSAAKNSLEAPAGFSRPSTRSDRCEIESIQPLIELRKLFQSSPTRHQVSEWKSLVELKSTWASNLSPDGERILKSHKIRDLGFFQAEKSQETRIWVRKDDSSRKSVQLNDHSFMIFDDQNPSNLLCAHDYFLSADQLPQGSIAKKVGGLWLVESYGTEVESETFTSKSKDRGFFERLLGKADDGEARVCTCEYKSVSMGSTHAQVDCPKADAECSCFTRAAPVFRQNVFGGMLVAKCGDKEQVVGISTILDARDQVISH